MANLLTNLQLVAGDQRGYNGGSTSVVANIPAGTQVGDVVVVVAAARNHNVSSASSGYTTIQSASGSSESGFGTPWIGYRRYVNGDTIPSTITLSGSAFNNGTASATFRATSGAPLTQVNIVGLTSASGGGSATTTGSVTATETIGSLLVGVGANSGNNNETFAFSSAMTELGDSGSAGGRMCAGLYQDTDPIVVGANSFPSVSIGRSEPWGYGAFILQGYTLDLWAGSHAPSLAGDGVGYGG